MKHGRLPLSLALAAGLTIATASSSAAQDKKAPAGPPDEKAMMEMMQKAATPGDAHKKLEPFVGTFDAKVKMWMDPSKPPEESAGKAENKWVLGNRWVEMQYEGTFMGQPFSGIGYTGYDNVTKKYVGTWMDTASTGVMTSSGSMAGKVMNSTASMSDPTTGKTSKAWSKVTIADNDHYTMEMSAPGPDGKPVKVMEIQYSRKK
jgi:hypothetical protein